MDQMSKLLNRISDARFAGNTEAGIAQPEPSPFARTRAEYVERILSEAVAYRVENLDAIDPGENPVPDDELDNRIDELRAAREDSPLAAYVLAGQLRGFLILSGYCGDDELPVYDPRA